MQGGDGVQLLIDNKSGAPIYEQIYTQLKEQIISGALTEDQPLPSIRALAKDLRISAGQPQTTLLMALLMLVMVSTMRDHSSYLILPEKQKAGKPRRGIPAKESSVLLPERLQRLCCLPLRHPV